MKKALLISFLALFFINCNNENSWNCLQKPGNTILETIQADVFTEIRVNRDISLVLKEGITQEIILETGENLLNDIDVSVANGLLTISDNNTCNFVRDYNVTTVYVTAPNITKILCSTQFDVTSDGVLNYPNLEIRSEDFNDTSILAVGNISLNINATDVTVVGNNLTHFDIDGLVNTIYVSLASGNGIFNGEDLIAQDVTIFHRGTNNLIVNPQNSLEGELRSTGNLISKNQPPIVNIEEFYTGRLIFD